MEARCRLCQSSDGAEDMVRPCECRGSIELAHPHCLVEWIARRRSLQCEICRSSYRIAKITAVPRDRSPDSAAVAAAAASPVQQDIGCATGADASTPDRQLSFARLLTRGRMMRTLTVAKKRIERGCEVAVPILLFSLVLPLLFGLGVYIVLPPALRRFVGAGDWGTTFEYIFPFLVSPVIVMLGGQLSSLWSSWFAWCDAHRDLLKFPFPDDEESVAHPSAFDTLVDLMITEVVLGQRPRHEEAHMDVDGDDDAEEVAAHVVEQQPAIPNSPTERRGDPFSPRTHAEEVAAHRVELVEVDAVHERGVILGAVDRRLSARTSLPFWRRPLPSYAVRAGWEVLGTVGVLLFLVCIVPIVAVICVTPLCLVANGFLAWLLDAPYMMEGVDPPTLKTSITTVALSNMLLSWFLQRCVRPLLPNAAQNSFTCSLTFIRGAAMTALLFAVSLTASALIPAIAMGDFFGQTTLPTSRLSENYAWAVLQRENLAPIQCQVFGSSRTRDPPVRWFHTLRALRFVKPTFFPSPAGRGGGRANDRSLFIVDANTCGVRLASFLSTIPSPPAGDDAVAHLWHTLCCHLRYVTYCAWCVSRMACSPHEVGCTPVLVMSATLLVVAARAGFLRGTALGDVVAMPSFHSIATLTVRRGLRLVVRLPLEMFLVVMTFGRSTLLLLSTIAPGLFPIFLDRLEFTHLWSLVHVGASIPRLLEMHNTLLELLSASIADLYDLPAAALDTPVLSWEHWRVGLGPAVVRLAYWLTLFACCVCVLALLFWVYSAGFPGPVVPVSFGLCYGMMMCQLLFPDVRPRLFLKAVRRRAPMMAHALLSKFVLQYVAGVEVDLKEPLLRLSSLHPLATHQQEIAALVIPVGITRLRRELDCEHHVVSLVGAARRELWREVEALPETPRALRLPEMRPGQRTMVSYNELSVLASAALRLRPVRLTAICSIACVCVVAPLIVGSLPVVPRNRLHLYYQFPWTVVLVARWITGCAVLALALAVEHWVFKTNFSRWLRQELVFWCFHPLHDVSHRCGAPLLFRCATICLWRRYAAWSFASSMDTMAAFVLTGSEVPSRPQAAQRWVRAATLGFVSLCATYYVWRRVRSRVFAVYTRFLVPARNPSHERSEAHLGLAVRHRRIRVDVPIFRDRVPARELNAEAVELVVPRELYLTDAEDAASAGRPPPSPPSPSHMEPGEPDMRSGLAEAQPREANEKPSECPGRPLLGVADVPPSASGTHDRSTLKAIARRAFLYAFITDTAIRNTLMSMTARWTAYRLALLQSLERWLPEEEPIGFVILDRIPGDGATPADLFPGYAA